MLSPCTAPSSRHFFLLTTSLRTDPTTQVVGGAGSGLRPGLQSPLQSGEGGGGRGQSIRPLGTFCLPRGLPSRVPRRVPCLTGTLGGTCCGTCEGTQRGTRVHVDAGTLKTS